MHNKELKAKILNEYYNNNLTGTEICNKYNISINTFKGWLKRQYPKQYKDTTYLNRTEIIGKKKLSMINKSIYKDMTNDEMRIQLINKDFEIERLKKKYQVQINPTTGEKQFVTFKDRNTK